MELYVIESTKTNNFNDRQMMQKVKTMWKRASQQLKNYSDCIYGLYYNYESDYKGDYHLSVAIEQNRSDISITIPEDETYEVFKVNTTDQNGILNTWKKIWELEDEGKLQRKYSYDFEKYYPDGNVEIHIAIK